MENEEQFSDNPDEQLRIENELLKLKLQAELGAQFGGNMSDLPPEVEQEFLKQIMAFQENQKNMPMVIFRDYIGSPEMPLAASLKDDELIAAWGKLETVLEEHYIQLQFPEVEPPVSVKYDFVVQDLFPLTIMQPSAGQGWIFDYDEFYPDHEKNMALITEEFMKDFFENAIDEHALYLSKEMINSSANSVLTKEALIDKLNRFHDLFNGVKNYKYSIRETKIDNPQKPGDETMGFVEGTVSYTIEREDRQEQEITGPFKLYFQKSVDWWEIFTFYVHGFSWE